ncbi:uncharacterized protein LOC108915613 [Anoplophora glabripennis]|uniref:uncharacterized protein LOC108915613 n=1 Tax=Anoplophora glabripennis TaxID=217634 RepID=UPI00087593BA|nr:uncharacterized protein LOC108915613 [Anoplophora glabripennis]
MLTRLFRKVHKLISMKFCTCNILTKGYASENESEIKFSGKRLGDMSSKYKIFHEQDSEIILDVYEERLKYSNLLEDEPDDNLLPGLNLERGRDGVFDIEDLVEVLKRENSKNIFVAKVPRDIKYVDYICIVSGKSQRHMQAIAQFVRKIFKEKRNKNDIVPKLEGEFSKDWMALDLGNIALHIFSTKSRELYDLDSLWAVGSKFDDEYNKKEPVSEMLGKHSYLEGLEPAS